MNKRKQRIYRCFAFFMALNLFFEVVSPTVALALTGGPSQPEVESFEPVTTSEMVDPFSGDFNYNIPLLTVPGPNGGYPVNLAYHAGIGMEQEASWVGLGWNINPGAITRQMRGLPDDFNGEPVRKELTYRPNVTFGVGKQTGLLAVNINEIFGLDVKINSRRTYEIFYNNYKGLGVNFGLQLVTNLTKLGEKMNAKPSVGLGLSLGTQSGIGLDPTVSFSKRVKNTMYDFNAGLGYNSRVGIYSMGVELRTKKLTDIKEKRTGSAERMSYTPAHTEESNNFSHYVPSGASYNGSSFTPYNSTSLYGFTAEVRAKFGKQSTLPMMQGRNFFGKYSMEGVDMDLMDLPSYGYNYIQNSPNGENGIDGTAALMDFNREKNYPVTKKTPALPVPIATNDIFSVSGQGTGGIFRAFRSDIGYYSDPLISNAFGGGMIGLEVAAGGAVHFGGVAGASISTSYSGKWNGNFDDLKTPYRFQENYASDKSLMEPFYYKVLGEKTAEIDAINEIGRFGSEDPLKLRINMVFSGIDARPKVHNQTVNGVTAISYNERYNREKRVQSVEYKTFEKIHDNLSYSSRPKYIRNSSVANTWSSNPADFTAYDYTYNSTNWDNIPRKSQIGTVSMVNPDGNRYEYSIPAYNLVQKDVMFSLPDHHAMSGYAVKKSITYTSTDASKSNDNFPDKFFSATTTPEYAHSYLLTAIYSADYVDLTGDGPSSDDLGYYVKFNYTDNGTYKWRVPYFDADMAKGFFSNNLDDKGYYTYGEKKMYYVQSIETKTHVAVFQLSSRNDGFGVKSEFSVMPGSGSTVDQTSPAPASLKKLDKIVLFSKNDLVNPLKTVNFQYDYSLCPGVPNNSTTSTSTIYQTDVTGTSNPQKPINGKLTLKKVWFEYLNNSKGRLSPYVFDYAETKYTGTGGVASNLVENPCYNLSQMDRWGYYKEDNYLGGSNATGNEDNPYVAQNDKATADRYMSMWNLKNITLPSGGTINVTYESDDYAYVQEKQAMQMFQIVSTGTSSNGFGHSEIDNNSTRIYFALEKDASGNPITNMNSYTDGIDHMYFKGWMSLKKKPDLSAVANDYVDGFCEIDKTAMGTVNVSGATYGYITVKQVPVTKKFGNTHPFRKASWEYLKNKRPDLLYNPSITDLQSFGIQFIYSFLTLVKEIGSTLINYWRYCQVTGVAKKIELSDPAHPSFIRLNTPDKIKYGGGHRVKQLKISDNWNTISGSSEQSFEYGQQYSYVMPDGTSSGVANYEPLVGAEEIPHHLPSDKYKNRDFIFASSDLYLVEPYGESYYPGASVGYRRVVVKSLRREDGLHNEINKSTASGSTVYEFYTAKEFPLVPEYTKVTSKKFSPTIPIPFIGMYTVDNKGYSQGYKFEINDMHGKLRSLATYAYSTDINNSAAVPVTKTEYIYSTKNVYDPDAVNRLNNWLEVLDRNKVTRMANVGMSSEFFMDLDQNSNLAIRVDIAPNVDASVMPPVVVPGIYPQFFYDNSMYRSVVTNKIIYKTGILTQVKNYKDGSTAITNNLIFDSETGQPRLTSVTNDFDAPIYTYDYAAHWQYAGMKGAYKNIGFKATVSGSGSSWNIGVSNHATYFTPGDEVVITNGTNFKNFWVTAVSASSITLVDESGAAPTSSYSNKELTIVRSGYRNQQSLSMGKVVSPSNFADGGDFPVFGGLNKTLADPNFNPNPSNNSSYQVYFTYNYYDCVNTLGSGLVTSTTIGGGSPTLSLPLPIGSIGIPPTTTLQNLKNLRFYAVRTGPVTASIYCYDITTPSLPDYSCGSVDITGCPVLHAEAYRYSDNYSGLMDYNDVNNPLTMTGSSLSTAASLNPYRFGAKGIWRNSEKYLYQVDRQQSSPTDVSKDGVYNSFVEHNWNVTYTNSLLNNWNLANTVTRYNVYGFETENLDALNLYSSAMYGYNNSMPVAVIKNSGYFEMGYEGFEEYGALAAYPTGSSDYYHGHFNFTCAQPLNFSTEAHTGSKSIILPSSNSLAFSSSVIDGTTVTMSDHSLKYFTPRNSSTSGGGNSNTQYLLSFWIKKQGALSPGTDVTIRINHVAPLSLTRKIEVEKWQKVEAVFDLANVSLYPTQPVTSFNLSIDNGGGSNIYIDDVRIQPFKSSMTSYVYDPVTLWLMAELDNRNYATFYNYDSEGGLVQVKQETEKGVMTIKSSRNNVKRNLTP